MSDQRQGGIAWTERTWNPIRGCTRVSAGCTNCYAERQAARFCGPGQPYGGLIDEHGRWNGAVRLIPEHLGDPLRWQTPRRVFVNSMSDLFHEGLHRDDILRVFLTMRRARQHIFQVLTKRPERMRELLAYWMPPAEALADLSLQVKPPAPNVWLGVSCEDQATANERIPTLLQTPAAVRWVSLEPLLGSIRLSVHAADPTIPREHAQEFHAGWLEGDQPLDWVVVGGESGPGARPCDVAWVRDIVRQCQGAGVPVFVKQLGSRPVTTEEDWRRSKCFPHHDAVPMPDTDADWDAPESTRRYGAVRLFPLDSKGGEQTEWAEDLRVREFPG